MVSWLRSPFPIILKYLSHNLFHFLTWMFYMDMKSTRQYLCSFLIGGCWRQIFWMLDTSIPMVMNCKSLFDNACRRVPQVPHFYEWESTWQFYSSAHRLQESSYVYLLATKWPLLSNISLYFSVWQASGASSLRIYCFDLYYFLVLRLGCYTASRYLVF